MQQGAARRAMPPKEIYIFLDGTFTPPTRTHSKIAVTNIPLSMAGMVRYILFTLLSENAPLAPKILLSAGHHDLSPLNLPTINPRYLDHNERSITRDVTDRVLGPLEPLYHAVARRGGTLWTTTLCPRPANLYINPVVSHILSQAFLQANAFISHLNHKQNLKNIPIHQVLQYPSLHPALRTMQKTINLRMYRRDALRLTSLAQERIWRKLVHILRQSWGPERAPLSGACPKPVPEVPYPLPVPRFRLHKKLEESRRRAQRRR